MSQETFEPQIPREPITPEGRRQELRTEYRKNFLILNTIRQLLDGRQPKPATTEEANKRTEAALQALAIQKRLTEILLELSNNTDLPK